VILCGDCIDEMAKLQTGSVDLVLSDVPYGQTQNDWDKPIPFEPMWAELRRVTKPDAAVIIMAAQPFASDLISSNRKEFRYDLIWSKNKPTGFLNAKKQPLRSHEHILVFYRKPPFYEPQMTTGHKPGNYARRIKGSSNYGAQTPTEYGGSTERYPTSIIQVPIVNNDDPEKKHPTQKPVDLMARLIRSYSKPGDLVLDIAAGSGTTAIAAIRESRRSICIEKRPEYFEVMQSRLDAERGVGTLLEAAQ
jgi:site-specific DNA-methyltransferase (adenine-specific)